MALSDAKVNGRPGSFGKKVGQMVLGFEKRDAPLHLQRRMQKPPRPWQATGRKKQWVILPWRIQHEALPAL
jgi:hypothetical protein